MYKKMYIIALGRGGGVWATKKNPLDTPLLHTDSARSCRGQIIMMCFCLLCRCRRWVINSRRADLDGKPTDYLHRNCFVCGEHFEVRTALIEMQYTR